VNLPRSKLVILALSSCAALAIGFAILSSWRPQHYRIVDTRAALEKLVFERQIEPRGLAAFTPGVDPSERLERAPLERETAQQLFASDKVFEYDPHTVYRYAPHLEQRIELPEFPPGSFVRRTNGAGEREEHETFQRPLDLFVLVAGDSHTDGVCAASETFPNVLEARLSERRPGQAVEVLNTGVSGYGPYQMLGVLEKYLAHGPRVFVTAFFGGNDFHDVLRLYHYFAHTALPKQERGYWAKLEQEKNLSRAALLQGLNQSLYFQRYPDEATLALKACTQVNAEIERTCRERGLPWIFVYIPSVLDRPGGEQAELRARSLETLPLSEWDATVADRLADALIAELRRLGVQVLDLRPVFASEAGPWYLSDMHINTRAQARIAELLEPSVEALLGSRGR